MEKCKLSAGETDGKIPHQTGALFTGGSPQSVTARFFVVYGKEKAKIPGWLR